MNRNLSRLTRRSALAGAIFALFGGGCATAADIHGIPGGNVHVDWNINALPASTTVSNLTFRFSLNNDTLHGLGTYYAQQFYFDNPGSGDNTAYLGLQPQPDSNGQSYLRAVFSSFIAGSTSTDANCSDGADGGAGVSCGLVFPADYSHDYEFTVHKTAEHTWSGDVLDKQTGNVVHAGSWTLPESVTNLQPSGSGFMEYYRHYQDGYDWFTFPSCDRLAKSDIVYGPVSTTDAGGAVGNVTNPYEYNSEQCQGAASGYSAETQTIPVTLADGQTLQADGVHIIRGFISDPNQ